MAPSTAVSPMHNSREIGVSSRDADSLSNAICRAGLERDMFDTRRLQPIDDLDSFSLVGIPVATQRPIREPMLCHSRHHKLNRQGFTWGNSGRPTPAGIYF